MCVVVCCAKWIESAQNIKQRPESCCENHWQWNVSHINYHPRPQNCKCSYNCHYCPASANAAVSEANIIENQNSSNSCNCSSNKKQREKSSPADYFFKNC